MQFTESGVPSDPEPPVGPGLLLTEHQDTDQQNVTGRDTRPRGVGLGHTPVTAKPPRCWASASLPVTLCRVTFSAA